MGKEINNKINVVLGIFYEYPDKKFTVREIARITRLPRASVHNYLLKLKKQKLVTKDNRAETNLIFKTKKINYYIEEIVASGLINEIVKIFNPSVIILFGSIRKGDSVKESDIDIFIESSIKKEITLKAFKKKLGHKIQLFIESDIHNLQPNLFNNVVNGIKLYGSFTIK